MRVNLAKNQRLRIVVVDDFSLKLTIGTGVDALSGNGTGVKSINSQQTALNKSGSKLRGNPAKSISPPTCYPVPGPVLLSLLFLTSAPKDSVLEPGHQLL